LSRVDIIMQVRRRVSQGCPAGPLNVGEKREAARPPGRAPMGVVRPAPQRAPSGTPWPTVGPFPGPPVVAPATSTRPPTPPSASPPR
jgi:hypothetical protein